MLPEVSTAPGADGAGGCRTCTIAVEPSAAATSAWPKSALTDPVRTVQT